MQHRALCATIEKRNEDISQNPQIPKSLLRHLCFTPSRKLEANSIRNLPFNPNLTPLCGTCLTDSQPDYRGKAGSEAKDKIAEHNAFAIAKVLH
ncbi:hypothetical protein VDG1235_2681 [Verrucomicrobiia bacterium DG1235]|nr:hypothetical protein VDG1235_2681 [Verrucomicrobiae bacterium DG1235]